MRKKRRVRIVVFGAIVTSVLGLVFVRSSAAASLHGGARAVERRGARRRDWPVVLESERHMKSERSELAASGRGTMKFIVPNCFARVEGPARGVAHLHSFFATSVDRRRRL